MKKIGFIGAFDKTDFILYIAKLLVELGQKVLFIDATITQKARYIVPNIQNTKSYITQFEGIDVAVGMKNYEEIANFLGASNSNELPYDIILIDTNSAGGVLSYRINECEKIYFATSMDLYSIKRGIESLAVFQNQIDVTKILFSKKSEHEEVEYINFLSKDSNISWAKNQNGREDIIYFPFEIGDETVIYKNQRVAKIRLRGFSSQYKEGLMYAVSQIIGETNYKELVRVFRKVEKGV